MTEHTMANGMYGKLVILSGPSGAGKSSLVRMLIQQCPLPLMVSVSATTRDPRPGEVEGVDYHFIGREGFQQLLKAGKLLEFAEVFGQGHWYGTPEEPVARGLSQGKWVILEIDVIGAKSVMERFPEAITIFVHPGSDDELERRLRGRRTDSEQAIKRRLQIARDEMMMAATYQHIIVNRDLQQASEEICNLLCRIGETAECTKS